MNDDSALLSQGTTQYGRPHAMDRQLDVLHCHTDGGLLLGASCLTGRYWLGSLWYYKTPESAPDVDKCTAGVQLEAGVGDGKWVDATHVLVGLDTGGVAVWNLEDDFRTFVLSYASSGHDGIVTGVSVSSSRTKAASCGHDQCIKLWDLSSMSLLYSSHAHSDFVSCIDCHPSQEDVLVTCAQDDRILLWDRRKPRPASILNKSPLQYMPTCVRWQPGQEHKLAVGSESGQIALLDTRKGVDNYLASSPHSRLVSNLQFNPSQPSLLASVSEDCKTSVVSIDEDGITQVYLDSTHQDFVHGLTWSSSDKQQLYSCGWDSKVLFHDLKTSTATPMGQVTAAASTKSVTDTEESVVMMNGSHDNETGAGDAGEDVEKMKSDSCKHSYSQAVKTPTVVTAEG